MRHPLLIALAAGLLAGCAGPGSPDGTWINQPIIDAAREGIPLHEALLAHGPVLEWRVDSQRGQAVFSNGFETPQGDLAATENGRWQVSYRDAHQDELEVRGDELVQHANNYGPEQRFARPQREAENGALLGSSFEWALYDAYLGGGEWKISEGVGRGGLVLFHPDGRLEGLPGADRYALCLAGDCASMTEGDSLWLQLGNQGASWLFERDGDRLRILEAVNRAAADEFPDYRPGRQAWLLERD